MSSLPEITVIGRKALSISKTAKRLRRFLGENRPPEAVVDLNNHDDAHQTSSAELVCGIPDETLFQLEQICEALEAKRKRRATMNDLFIAPPLPPEQDEAKVMETPKKKSKKRPRDDGDQASVPRTEVKKPAEGDKSELKKKKRRKSAVV